MTRADARASLRGDLLSCGWRASRSDSPRPSAVSVWRLHPVVRPPRGFRSRCSRPCYRTVGLPQAFAPLQSVPRAPPRRGPKSRRPALSRFSSPPARINRKEPPFPGLPRPGHVAPSPLPWASTPCSPSGLPGLFQPGALLGFRPSELPSSKIVRAFRPDCPSCDSRIPASDRRPAEAVRRDVRLPVPVGPGRPRYRGFLPSTPRVAAAGFPRWPRLPWLSWASSSLRLSPPRVRTSVTARRRVPVRAPKSAPAVVLSWTWR